MARQQQLKRLVWTPNGSKFPKVNKVSKVQVKTELLNPRSTGRDMMFYVAIEDIYPSAPVGIIEESERELYSDSDILNTREIFGVNGKMAHVLDGLNGIFTHARESILGQKEEQLFYEMHVPKKDFELYCLGEYHSNIAYKHYLYNEVRNTGTKGSNMAMYYEKDGKSYFTVFKPIIFPAITYKEPTSKQNAIGGKITDEITILAFKPLFGDLLKGTHGENWLYMPFALSARIRGTLDKHRQEFIERFGSSIRDIGSLRRLLIYLLSLGDFRRGTDLVFDPVEMAFYCNDSLVRSWHEGKFRRRDAYNFVNKALFTFKQMQQDGYLDGLKVADGDYFTVLPDGNYKVKLLEMVNLPWKNEMKRLPN